MVKNIYEHSYEALYEKVCTKCEDADKCTPDIEKFCVYHDALKNFSDLIAFKKCYDNLASDYMKEIVRRGYEKCKH